MSARPPPQSLNIAGPGRQPAHVILEGAFDNRQLYEHLLGMIAFALR
jgi:hypothetical protein